MRLQLTYNRDPGDWTQWSG